MKASDEGKGNHIPYFRGNSFLNFLMIYSSLILFIALFSAVGFNDSVDGYLTKPNWFLYVIFWPIIFLLYAYTWNAFLDAWKSLSTNGCIYSMKEKNTTPSAEKMVEVFNLFTQYRRKSLVAAVLVTLPLMYVDTLSLQKAYGIPEVEYRATPKKFVIETVEVSYLVSAGGKEFFIPEKKHLANPLQNVIEKKESPYFAVKGTESRLDHDWCDAWLFDKTIGKVENLIFVVIAYIQQFIIIVLAFAAFFHICLHIGFFYFFEKLSVTKANDLQLRLIYDSNVYEFGLEKWNYALNNIYWVLAVAVLIPIASQSSQPVAGDVGQTMIKQLVPLIFGAPMVFTIVVRQARLPEVWSRVEHDDDDRVALFHKQLLWPLDRNWASKLGIVIAFALLSALLGTSVLNFVGF